MGRDESDSIQSFRSKVFLYMMMKTVGSEHVGDFFLPGLRDFFRLTSSSTTTERSVVHFVDLNSKPADNKETLLSALATLHEKHGVGKYVDFLVVAGDGKTFDHLINLKREYGEELNWMLPYLGEWHLLKNVQVPIFKVYLDGGLSQLLRLYHKGATSAAVSNSTCFDKSHTFLLQAWEAFFRSFISFFLSESNQDLSFLDDFQAASQDEFITLFKRVDGVQKCKEIENNFKLFCDRFCEVNPTFKFWFNFVYRDMIFYAGLFMAIRGRLFQLRNACVRQFAPLFHICVLLPFI